MATNKELHDILFPKADLTLEGFEYMCKDCTEDKNCTQCYQKEIPNDIKEKILSLFFKTRLKIVYYDTDTDIYIFSNKEASEVEKILGSIFGVEK